MAVVGPGAIQQNDTSPTPTLAGASEYEYITVLNPLPDDFAIRVAQDVPVNMPFEIARDLSGKTAQTTLTERDAAQTYGLSLKNPDFKSRKHIVNDTIIKAGETINLKGNEAQVAVRQLTNEILQRQGQSRLMADPFLRQKVEAQIIKHRGSIQQLMDSNLQSTRNQIDNAIAQSNEVRDEPAFPGIETISKPSGVTDSQTRDASSSDRVQRKNVGSPKKADS